MYMDFEVYGPRFQFDPTWDRHATFVGAFTAGLAFHIGR